MVALLIGGAALLGPGVGQAFAGSISGNVHNGSTNLAGIQVDAFPGACGPAGGFPPPTQTTDSNGNYSFTGLADATYHVVFRAPSNQNYLDQWYNNKSSCDTADGVTVNSSVNSGDVTGIDANLTAGAIISGTVTKSAAAGGGNASGIRVSASNASDPNASGGGALTAADGTYSINKLPAGDYKLQFADSHGVLAEQWYNNHVSKLSADTITLAAGATASGKNAVMAPGGTISGHLSSSGGAGADGICPRALISDPQAGGSYSQIGSGYTGNAGDTGVGDYSLTGLPAGTYKLDFAPCGGNFVEQFWNNKPDLATADTIVLAEGQSHSGVNGTMQSPGGTTSSGTGTTSSGGGTTSAGGGTTATSAATNGGSSSTTPAGGGNQANVGHIPAGAVTIAGPATIVVGGNGLLSSGIDAACASSAGCNVSGVADGVLGGKTARSARKKSKLLHLGSVSFHLDGGKHALVVFQLSHRVVRRLAKLHSLPVKFKVTISSPGGADVVSSRTVAVRAAKHGHK